MTLGRFAAALCLVLGSLLMIPQIFADDPWQAGFLGGLILFLAGMVILADDPDWRGRDR